MKVLVTALLSPPLSKYIPNIRSLSSIQLSMAASNNNLLSQHINRLKSSPKKSLLLDGGTGEELFLNGVPDDRKIWSATAIVHQKYHSTVEKVHRSFVEAGSHAITTNSYGIIPGAGFIDGEEVKRLTGIAGKIGRKSVTNEDGGATALVLGSLGPLVESYRPDLIMKHSDGVKCYQYAIEGLSPYVDVYIAETMSCVEEACQVVDALSTFYEKTGVVRKPLLVSFTLNDDGKLRSSESIVDAIQKMVEFASDKKVELIGILVNCCEPESVTKAMKEIETNSQIHQYLYHPPRGTSSHLPTEDGSNKVFFGAYANKLTSVDPQWTMATSTEAQPMRNDLPPESYSIFARDWHNEYGVQLIGGCCGIGPDHITCLREKLQM